MTRVRDTTAIILAAGSGSRLGAPTPKQYLTVGDRQIIDYSIDTFLQTVDRTIVVIPASEMSGNEEETDRLTWVRGGETRAESVRNGLTHVDSRFTMVHDAARPFVPSEIILTLRSELDHAACAYPVLPVANTVVVEREGQLAETLDRSSLRDVQTPQGFLTDVLRGAMAEAPGRITHLPEIVRQLGHEVRHISGSPRLFKVTYEPSLYAAEYYAGQLGG